MRATLIAAGVIAIAGAVVASLTRLLARRVVGVEPKRRTITVRRVGDDVELPRSLLTLSEGRYGLWFGDGFQNHAVVGPVVYDDTTRVVRRVIESGDPIPDDRFDAQWTGHIMRSPGVIDPDWEDVSVPLRGGGSAPAWLFRGKSPESPWVIHVQGARTSRLVTLRSVDVAHRAGLTSLAITYRGSGDGPPAATSSLGQREWSDLSDAIAYARSNGATAVYVVAWSMGAGIALELLRRQPEAFDRLALIAPATNWNAIIRYGVSRAGLPRFMATMVMWAMGSRVPSRLVGLVEPLDFERLDWSRTAAEIVPTLTIHSQGDEEIPFELTRDFSAAHEEVTLVETAAAPHAWEANVSPELFRSTLTSWFASESSPADGSPSDS